MNRVNDSRVIVESSDIRLDKGVESADITAKTQNKKDAIREKINEVKDSQSELYNREWEANDEYEVADDDIENSFIAMQFNILAQGLSSGPEVEPPFPGDIERNNYGRFTIPNKEIILDFEKRKWRILEVILAHSPDVLALEEIDRFYSFFEPNLAVFGYEGFFIPKPTSPCIESGWYSDGCALFWKKETFELILNSIDAQRYTENNSQIFIAAKLTHKKTRKTIKVAVTHLKAKGGKDKDEIRMKQVQRLIQALKDDENSIESPLLIMGDFNTGPTSGCIKELMEKLDVTSAYNIYDEQKLEYTTCKLRGKISKQIIDYIFHNDGLHCSNLLSVPKESELEEHKLPGLKFPSDHINIAAKFCFRLL